MAKLFSDRANAAIVRVMAAMYVWKLIRSLLRMTDGKHMPRILPPPPPQRVKTSADEQALLSEVPIEEHWELRQSHMVNAQGIILFFVRVFPKPPRMIRGVVIISHGLWEHSGRYRRIIDLLSDRGFAVYALDHQGHGQSEGDRGYFERLQHLVDDVCLLAQRAKDEVATCHKVPMFLFGHSLGGLLVTLAATKSSATTANFQNSSPIKWQGVVLSSPAFAPPPGEVLATMPGVAALSAFLSRVLPKLPLLKLPSYVSRDPIQVGKYLNDPLNTTNSLLCVRCTHEIFKQQQRIKDIATHCNWPYLLIQGGADVLVDPSIAHVFHEATASNDKELHVIPGCAHEVLHEPEGPKIEKQIVTWIEKRLDAV